EKKADTPVTLAVRLGRADALQALLRTGCADINSARVDGVPLLQWSMQHANSDVVHCLLTHPKTVVSLEAVKWLGARQTSANLLHRLPKEEVSKIVVDLLMPREEKCGGYSATQTSDRLAEFAKFKGKTRVVGCLIDEAVRLDREYKLRSSDVSA